MHVQIHGHTHGILRLKVAQSQSHGICFSNLYLGTVSLETGGILFPESSLQNQACWESANHNRRHQISGASGYTYWSLQGLGKNFFFFFCVRRLAQLSADIALAFLWSVSYQKLNKPDGAAFWFKVTKQTNVWKIFLLKMETELQMYYS